MNQHSELAAGRWHRMALADQLGNVGSEYERACRWRLQKDDRFESAFNRMLELFDLTAVNPHISLSARREVLRARECACESLLVGATDERLARYFNQFALLARRDR